MTQTYLTEKPKVVYHSDFYNKINDTEQWIRLTDGCFRNCWNCYAPQDRKVYDLPEIVRNKVVFLDMNFLWAHPNPEQILQELSEKRVNGKVVYYDFYCGLDFTLLNQDRINLCKKARIGWFSNKRKWYSGLRIAWDRGINEQIQMQRFAKALKRGGYDPRYSQCFMLCNGKIPYSECEEKLRILLRWNIGVRDCWYNNQRRGSVDPIYWTKEQCIKFGRLCRDHNHLINRGIYARYLKTKRGK